jgi:hypothetical protein
MDTQAQIKEVAREVNELKGLGADVTIRHSKDSVDQSDNSEWIGVFITIPDIELVVEDRFDFYKAIYRLAAYLTKYI